MGGGEGGGRGRSFYMILVYWLERIFEICNHILENAFFMYTIFFFFFKYFIYLRLIQLGIRPVFVASQYVYLQTLQFYVQGDWGKEPSSI